MIGLKKRDIKKALKAGAKASGMSLADVQFLKFLKQASLGAMIHSLMLAVFLWIFMVENLIYQQSEDLIL